MLTLARYLDTPGIMGRDLLQCRKFAASWYGEGLAFAGSKVFEPCCCNTGNMRLRKFDSSPRSFGLQTTGKMLILDNATSRFNLS